MTYRARTKYDEPGRARRYAARSPRRDEQEWDLLARVLDGLPVPPADALDVPCGTGRIADRLLERGIATRGADISAAMRAEAWKRLHGRPGFLGVVPFDLEAPAPDPTLAADLVLCFRLLHHLPDEGTRGRVLATLAALSRRWVVVSFHHPASLHNLTRRLTAALTGRPSGRFSLTRRRLAREAAARGLRLVEARGLAPGLRDFWIALLEPVRPARAATAPPTEAPVTPAPAPRTPSPGTPDPPAPHPAAGA